MCWIQIFHPMGDSSTCQKKLKLIQLPRKSPKPSPTLETVHAVCIATFFKESAIRWWLSDACHLLLKVLQKRSLADNWEWQFWRFNSFCWMSDCSGLTIEIQLRNPFWSCGFVAFPLLQPKSGPQLLEEPIQSFVKAFPSNSTSSLNVPFSFKGQSMKLHFITNFWVKSTKHVESCWLPWQVMALGKSCLDAHISTGAPLRSSMASVLRNWEEHSSILSLSFASTWKRSYEIAGNTDSSTDKDERLHMCNVVTPQWLKFFIASNILPMTLRGSVGTYPDQKFPWLVFHIFVVESWNRVELCTLCLPIVGRTADSLWLRWYKMVVFPLNSYKVKKCSIDRQPAPSRPSITTLYTATMGATLSGICSPFPKLSSKCKSSASALNLLCYIKWFVRSCTRTKSSSKSHLFQASLPPWPPVAPIPDAANYVKSHSSCQKPFWLEGNSW